MLCLVICWPTHGKFCSFCRWVQQDHRSTLGTEEVWGSGRIGAPPSDDLQRPSDLKRGAARQRDRASLISRGLISLICRKAMEPWKAWISVLGLSLTEKIWSEKWRSEPPRWIVPTMSRNSRLAVKIPKFGPGSVHYGSLVNIKIRDKWMLMKYGTFWLFDVSMEHHYFNWIGNHYISSVNEPFTIAMFNSQRVYIIGFHMSPWVEYLCNVSGWHAWAHLQQ